jgi:signal transduction histidine kinase
MKIRISLKLSIALAFLVLAFVLILTYSWLSIYFFRTGVDSITALNMKEVAQSYMENVSKEQRYKLNSYYGYHIASEWEQLPADLQNSFKNPPSADKNFKISREPSPERKEIVKLIFRYEENGETLFVGRRTFRPSGSNPLGKNTHESRQLLFILSIIISSILAISILFFYRQISKPVIALEKWTSSLGPAELEQPSPDFSYPELNRMAELVRSSLSKVQDSLEREHKFLRYASHELRTPIATIRNNIELVPKIEQLQEPRKTEELGQLFGRVDRSSLNMQYLTETLLWLFRDDVDTIPPKQLQLDDLVRELVEEMNYLLERKEVDVEIGTDPCIVSVQEIPAQIILRNLIRNAFQHTEEGTITVSQQGEVVSISNPQPDQDEKGDETNLGFGFGLQLIEQLTQKLNWSYTAYSETSTYTASISLTQRPGTQ